MLILIAISFLILITVGYYKSRTFFSPYVLVSALWFAIIILYYLLPHNFFPIQNRFPICILIWVVGYYISSMVIEYVTPAGRCRHTINEKLYNVEILIACLSTIYIAYTFIKMASSSDYFFLYLRSLSTGLDENISTEIHPIWGYFRSAMMIVYLIELTRFKSKKRITLFLILNLMTAFVTMAKSHLFSIAAATIIIMSNKKVIRMKHVALLFAVFLITCILIQMTRSMDGDEFSIEGFLSAYILSGSIAFDYFDLAKISGEGGNVFRFFESTLYRIGFTSHPANPTILEYTQVGTNNITNVYTIMYPYFADYGYIGVFVFSIINGGIGGYFSKKARNNDAAFIMYAVIASTIIFGFFGDLVFTNLSTMIQYLIYAYLPYYRITTKTIRNNG